jgi:L-Ala-D/L-Glu epimerase
MHLSTRRIELTKRFPLTISRGTITGATSVVISIEHDGIVGMGEMAPSDVTGDTPELCEEAIEGLAAVLDDRGHLRPFDRVAIDHLATDLQLPSATRCAIDLALHDWMGKRAGLPLFAIWGLSRAITPPTSLTVGINPPDVVEARTIEVLNRTGAKVLKVKLGSPAGLDHDREILMAAQRGATAAGCSPAWRVDANAGWSMSDALAMSSWLADRGVTYIEQPLPVHDDGGLAELSRKSSLPIYADESVHTSSDVARLAGSVAGVNLKLMKAGGIAEGMRIISTARAHGMSVMIGCMGESSLSIAAGAHLSAMVDEVDLDSHLNLTNDPFVGLTLLDGVVMPNELPGLGISYAVDHQADATGAR